MSVLEQMEIHKDDMVWYLRGQADSSWNLEPSLCRCFVDAKINRNKAHGIEFSAFQRFQSQAHLYIPSSTSGLGPKQNIAWWMLMQHYSCPTRLLDWTLSPYVAAYFGIDKLPKVDGAIWFFNAPHLDTIMSKQYGKMNELDSAVFFANDPIPAVYPILGGQHSERSLLQQGTYTVCTDIFANHGELISEAFTNANLTNSFGKLTIPHQLKYDFLSRLRTMNITASALFPEIDGIGRAISEHVHLRIWSKV
jgi:hypothetical protein